MANDILVGARVRLSINGKKVGFATVVDIQEEEEVQDVDVLDNIETEEFVTVGYRVSGTFGVIAVVGKSLREAGIVAKVGKSPDEHLENILNLAELTATLYDKRAKKNVATLTKLKVTGQSFSIGARSMGMRNASFRATRLQDESEV